MDKPADFIDPATIDLEFDSIAKMVRQVIRRFYGEPFTARHVFRVLQANPKLAGRLALYDAVRAEVHNLKNKGKIFTVSTGTTGNGNCSIFKEPC